MILPNTGSLKDGLPDFNEPSGIVTDFLPEPDFDLLSIYFFEVNRMPTAPPHEGASSVERLLHLRFETTPLVNAILDRNKSRHFELILDAIELKTHPVKNGLKSR